MRAKSRLPRSDRKMSEMIVNPAPYMESMANFIPDLEIRWRSAKLSMAARYAGKKSTSSIRSEDVGDDRQSGAIHGIDGELHTRLGDQVEVGKALDGREVCGQKVDFLDQIGRCRR